MSAQIEIFHDAGIARFASRLVLRAAFTKGNEGVVRVCQLILGKLKGAEDGLVKGLRGAVGGLERVVGGVEGAMGLEDMLGVVGGV